MSEQTFTTAKRPNVEGTRYVSESFNNVWFCLGDSLWIDYTNWKGRRAWREIIIRSLPAWRITPIHQNDTTAMRMVIDVEMVDKQLAPRTICLADIHNVSREKPNV